MRKFTLLLGAAMLALCGLTAQAEEKEIVFSHGEGTSTWGNASGKIETYDVAMHLTDPGLVGLTVRRLRIPFRSIRSMSENKAWLSVALPTIKSGKMQTPDVVQVEFTPVADGWAEVELPEGYTIGAEGVYVGYSFKMGLPNDASVAPVVTTAGTAPEAFLVHTTQTNKTKFRDLYPDAGMLAMEVVLSGENIADRAVSLTYLPEARGLTGTRNNAAMEVVNHGRLGATTLDYTVAMAGVSESQSAAVQLRPCFGDVGEVEFSLPAVSERGAYDYSVRIDKVDGEPNADANAELTAQASVYNTLPKHRAVLEEYTGTWCGYCPRGFVGLEEMNRLFPDDFIGISYHNDDPMEITSQFPSPVSGFPDAWLDRVYQTDAFCGIANYGEFGIDYVWQYRCDEFAPAAIECSQEWADDDHLMVTARTTFPIDLEEAPYRLSFVLIHDGMKGTGSSWSQSNYYAGATGWPSSMDQFTQGASYVSGLEFNDVIIARSDISGIEGSVTAPAEADVEQEYSYTFDLTTVKNTSNQPLIQDKAKVRAAVLLIDTRDGSIANASKTRSDEQVATGLGRTTTADGRDASIVSLRFFNMKGQLVDQPQHGLYLRQETLKSGRVRTVKVNM